MRYFNSCHLPPHLREVARYFEDLARIIVNTPAVDAEEQAVALRKLLEAKDAAVRCVLGNR